MNEFDKRRLIVAFCFGSGLWLGFASHFFVACLIGIYWFVCYGFERLIYSPHGWGLSFVLLLLAWQYYWLKQPEEPKQPRGRPLGTPRRYEDR